MISVGVTPMPPPMAALPDQVQPGRGAHTVEVVRTNHLCTTFPAHGKETVHKETETIV